MEHNKLTKGRFYFVTLTKDKDETELGQLRYFDGAIFIFSFFENINATWGNTAILKSKHDIIKEATLKEVEKEQQRLIEEQI